MKVLVTGTTTKTIGTCTMTIEGSSISSNYKYKNSNSCERRVDAAAAATTT
jgi:hypothetical protein